MNNHSLVELDRLFYMIELLLYMYDVMNHLVAILESTEIDKLLSFTNKPAMYRFQSSVQKRINRIYDSRSQIML